MAGNSFGQIFRITTFGESHGAGTGVVIDGCPTGIEVNVEDVQVELDRRRPGQSKHTSPRNEKDSVEILSGIFEGKTLGTPIAMVIYNQDGDSSKYKELKDLYRPGHADYTYEAKYGARDWRGGGRASARETIGRVAAGAIAKKILSASKIDVVGYIIQIGKQKVGTIDETVINNNDLYCPDLAVYEALAKEIADAKKQGDSVGGVVEVVAHGVPAGLGEPVFRKLSADLAAAVMSIPAVKGVEIGDGFASAARHGSDNNDEWIQKEDGQIGTITNRAGGIIGGISTGEDIVLRFALKPTSSIIKEQNTVNRQGKSTTVSVKGRHDPCVCPRAVPIAEAMVALVLVDHYLSQKIQK